MERGEERGEFDGEGSFTFSVPRSSPLVAVRRRCRRANDGRFGGVF